MLSLMSKTSSPQIKSSIFEYIVTSDFQEWPVQGQYISVILQPPILQWLFYTAKTAMSCS